MDNVLEMAALGRPFSLGMLYDCRSDMIVPGVTLWDRAELETSKTVQDQSSTKCSVITGNEEGDKFDSLGISADLKLSVMSGQVNVSGAAKYLNTKNSTQKCSTVTHHYEAVTEFEQMNMEQLGVGGMKHLNILESCTATHVVTGILYGADVFLEFSASFEQSDSNQNIQGDLKIAVEKLPSLSAEGSGTINLDERQHSLIDKIKCSFNGDVPLETPPTTFSEAVDVYRQIPRLVEKGKQKRVWLHPLVKLHSSAQTLVRQISDEVVGRVANYMGFLNECQTRANDLKSDDACQKFYRLQSQLATFCDQIKDCDYKFKSEILPLLPRVRGGSAEECELLSVLRKFEESQFSESRLTMWLDNKKTEIKVLNKYSNKLKDIPFVTWPGELEEIVSSFDYKYVYVLTFSLGDVFDSYLEAQSVFLKNPTNSEYTQNICNNPWFKSEDFKYQIMGLIKEFTQTSKLPEEDSKQNVKVHCSNDYETHIKFIVTEKLQQEPEGVIMILYEDAKGSRFKIPGRPSKPSSAETTETTASLHWNFSDFGKENILGSEIFMLACHEDEPDWQLANQISGNEVSATISNLIPSGKYKFKICPLSRIGHGPKSIESEIVTTKPPQQLEENDEIEDMKSIPTQQQRLAHRLVQQSELVKLGENGDPSRYLLPTTEIFRDDVENITKVIIGTKTPDSTTDKILMLMGATGAGKTTLLNAFANYYYGVKWEDEFRFVVVKEKEGSHAESQTKTITAYSFEPMEGAAVPYRTIIVDTPGFGSTAGLKEDKNTVEKIGQFLSKPGYEGISHLNGVGFVVQAHLAQLNASQKFVLDQILANFGKNIKQNIFLMITFADGQVPPVLAAVRGADIAYQEVYRFNNSALFANNSWSINEDGMDLGQMFWEIGHSTMEIFFKKFGNASLVSPATSEVLNLRSKITTAVQELDMPVSLGFGRLKKINVLLALNPNVLFQMLEMAIYEFDVVRNHVIHLIYQLKENLMKLDEITQRRNPLTCVDYIELLIQSEKEEMKPGWDERITFLNYVKEEAHLVDQISKEEFTPWSDYEKQLIKRNEKKDDDRFREVGIIFRRKVHKDFSA